MLVRMNRMNRVIECMKKLSVKPIHKKLNNLQCSTDINNSSNLAIDKSFNVLEMVII